MSAADVPNRLTKFDVEHAPQAEFVFSGIRCNAFLSFYIKHKQFRPQMCQAGWQHLVVMADFLADVPKHLQNLCIFGRRL